MNYYTKINIINSIIIPLYLNNNNKLIKLQILLIPQINNVYAVISKKVVQNLIPVIFVDKKHASNVYIKIYSYNQ
jgi:hypothetical protein